MRKTALNQLLDWCKEFDESNIKPTHTNMKEKIWQLLETEKQHIVEAYECGYTANSFDPGSGEAYLTTPSKNSFADLRRLCIFGY